MATYSLPNYGPKPTFETSPVDGVGTIMLALEEEGWPGVFATSALSEGPLDMEAMNEAVAEAAVARPNLTSVLAVVGPTSRQRLVWRQVNKLPQVEFVDRSTEAIPEGHTDTWLPDVDLNTDPWMPDLTVEGPVKLRMTLFAHDLHVFTLWGHHLAGDASFFAMFLLDWQARYHEKVTGEVPEWAVLPSLYAVFSATPAPEVDVSGWRGRMRELVAEDRAARKTGVGQILGTPGKPAPLVAAATIEDDSAIDDLRGRARSLGGSITDLAVVTSMLTIAEWNAGRGVEVTNQRHDVALNLRGRLPDSSDASVGNEGTLYEIASTRADWEDPDALVRRIATDRKSFIDRADYLVNMKVQQVVRQTLLRVPVKRRLRIISAMAGPRSLFLSNLGLVFPEIIDGEFTGRAGLQEVGHSVIHAVVMQGNPNPACPNLLPLMTGRLGLHLALSGNRATTTSAELSQVLQLFVQKLLNFPA